MMGAKHPMCTTAHAREPKQHVHKTIKTRAHVNQTLAALHTRTTDEQTRFLRY